MDEIKKTGPKDVFMHLLAIITLYLSAFNVGALIFQILNIYLPDPLTDYYHYSYREDLRWAVATVLIGFPVFVWLNWFNEKDLRLNPEKRELRTRKWLLHFTLFAAAVVIIGDLITLVYNFLQGELTLRFILKIFTVLLIAVVIFRYYLWNLRKDLMPSAEKIKTVFSWAVIVLVTAVTVVGFWVAGLPKSQRLVKFDVRRTEDLSLIQGQILTFWQQKDRIPENLVELNDQLTGFVPPTDPQDKTPYEYRRTGDLSFQICANFRTDNRKDTGGKPYRGYPPYPRSDSFYSWDHGEGRSCFDRKIDPELYGKRPGPPLVK